uniref:Uncharacterized protein n=1 Tax=uncultured bacterium contig00006 TaxID=1181498 RepID=A0A806KGU8_9BACT|nr:hypothetical protein [uncultured bacterium contig00006]
MSTNAEQVARMVDMLPDSEQLFALEFVKRLILAWDSDYTKVTPLEAAAIEEGREAIRRGEVFRDDEIDWDAPPVV